MAPWHGQENMAGKQGLLTEISTQDFAPKEQWIEAPKKKITRIFRVDEGIEHRFYTYIERQM